MISRCSHDLLVDTISEMEHCITKIGTEVDFCQVAFFVSSWENMPLIFQKNISGSKHVICQHFSGPPGYSFLLQEWPKCLLQPCRGATWSNFITTAHVAKWIWSEWHLSSHYQGGGNLDSTKGWTSNCNWDGKYCHLFKQHLLEQS